MRRWGVAGAAVPVVLVTGVDPDAMAAATLAVQLDLPDAVAVRHLIDPDAQTLTRVVSDVTGILERESVSLEHACVSCALREDIVPTLERLARDGRWGAIVAHLPYGAEAEQACRVLSMDARLARVLRVGGVVAALDGARLEHDLLGDDLLRERDLHSSEDDARGVGETACAMIELADVVTVCGHVDPRALRLVRAMARPDALVVSGEQRVDASVLAAGVHDPARALAWASPVRHDPLPPLLGEDVWRLDLRSPQPFHPGRLLEDLELLGGGLHRGRGCFWLPTRPGQALVWDGSGGQLSIGSGERWGRRDPFTRLVLIGTGLPDPALTRAFNALLLTPDEAAAGRWHTAEDGFELWLGPLRGVA